MNNNNKKTATQAFNSFCLLLLMPETTHKRWNRNSENTKRSTVNYLKA